MKYFSCSFSYSIQIEGLITFLSLFIHSDVCIGASLNSSQPTKGRIQFFVENYANMVSEMRNDWSIRRRSVVSGSVWTKHFKLIHQRVNVFVWYMMRLHFFNIIANIQNSQFNKNDIWKLFHVLTDVPFGHHEKMGIFNLMEIGSVKFMH